MYLEISGRRSGKTTRLLTAIHKAYHEGKKIAVFVPNYGMGHPIRDAIEENNYVDTQKCQKVNVYHSRKEFDKRLLDTGLLPEDFKVFYDEFDYSKDKVIISEDGYYVTTPCKIRRGYEDIEDDSLLKLLDMNKGSYVRHVNKELVDAIYTDEEYRYEIRGEFICE